MTNLAIIHYMPLEYYPPVTNFLDTLADRHNSKLKIIKVYSCHNIKGRKSYFIPQDSENGTQNHLYSFIINRSPFPKENDNRLVRLYKYIHFNLSTLLNLVIQWPNNLLYYESYSAWPAYIYSRFFNRQCRIFIHNHEYADKGWYATTMHQVRYFHRLEIKWLYPRALWNSQTNSDRLKFFHTDHPTLRPETLRIMPNYPPLSWKLQIESSIPDKPALHKPNILKVVYVGSLSFQNTYLKEFCNWVIQQNGQIQFDIYAYNLYNDVKEYLNNLGSSNIHYFEKGIEYKEMPLILSKYHVGLILYKAHNANYTFNAPNKLFEYLACKIDVWYHSSLEGPQAYNTINSYPQVIPVDFENLSQFIWQAAIDKNGKIYKPSEYYCEDVYSKLLKEIIKS